MMIKIFTPDKSGKISFTPEELQKLLQEIEKDAYERGKEVGKKEYIYWPWYTNSPSITYTDTKPNWDYNKITCNDSSTLNATDTTTTTTAKINKFDNGITYNNPFYKDTSTNVKPV